VRLFVGRRNSQGHGGPFITLTWETISRLPDEPLPKPLCL
jgi:hypothetical protein